MTSPRSGCPPSGFPPADGPAGQVWRPSVTALTTGFLWPSRVQAAAGQPWVACVAAISDPFASTIQRPGRVDFTLRGGWSNPPVRDLIGVCRQDPLEYLSCAQPHRSEVFADADLSAPELTQDQLISILFTATPDLTADFPAYAARQLGLTDVPLMCAVEIAVPGAMPRVIRLLAHVDTPRERSELVHVYLEGAAALRRDLPQ